MEIAAKANIQVNQDEVQHEIEHTLSHLLSGMSEKEARRTFNNDALRGLTANVYNNNLLANTLKHLRALASGELENQPEALEESTAETSSLDSAPVEPPIEAVSGEEASPASETPEPAPAELAEETTALVVETESPTETPE